MTDNHADLRHATTSRRRTSVVQRRLASGALLLLAACSSGDATAPVVPSDADARARSYLTLFTQHRGAEAEARLHPALAGAEAHGVYATIDSLIGGQQLDSLHVVGSEVDIFNGVRHVNLVYEARPVMGRVLAHVATVDSAGTWFVTGIAARTIPMPVKELGAFTLAGRSPKHYAWLLLTCLCVATSLGTAAWFATRRNMPDKWQWALFALVGVGAFRIDWSTGESMWQLLHVQLGSAAVSRPDPFAPWLLTFAVPLGAMLGLARYRWLPREMSPAHELPNEPEAAPAPARPRGDVELAAAPTAPNGWNERLLVRLGTWVESLSPSLRPAAFGALFIVYFMLMRGALIVLPIAIVAVFFTSATPLATLARGAMIGLLAMGAGASSGLAYGLVGRHVQRAFPGGRYLAGIVTTAPYMVLLRYIIRLADREPALAPWTTQDMVISLVMTLLVGIAIGATWFAPEKQSAA